MRSAKIDCVHAQADLSLGWSHKSYRIVDFVVHWLNSAFSHNTDSLTFEGHGLVWMLCSIYMNYS